MVDVNTEPETYDAVVAVPNNDPVKAVEVTNERLPLVLISKEFKIPNLVPVNVLKQKIKKLDPIQNPKLCSLLMEQKTKNFLKRMKYVKH